MLPFPEIRYRLREGGRMEGKVVPIRYGRRRRPIWFDVEDRERLIVRLSILCQGIWRSVQETHKKHPPTGIGKKALEAAAKAEEAGGLLYVRPGFMKFIRDDAMGMVIKQMYIDNNAWIENLWFPILAEFKGKMLWDTLTPDPRSKEKWRKRLLVCDKTVKDLELGRDVTVYLTERLLRETTNLRISGDALEKRLIKSSRSTGENV